MKIAKGAGRALLTLTVLLSLALFLCFPARYAGKVFDGIKLWAVSVLPATLPFLFLTAILTHLPVYRKVTRYLSPVMGKLFAVSGEGGCAALLSALSGYPVGARTVMDLAENGRLEEKEKFRVAALATTSGPAFLVGAVGCGMWKNAAIGYILYASHLAGIYLVCLLLRIGKKYVPQRNIKLPAKNIDLSDTLLNAVLSVLCVGAAIAIFYAFGAMISDMGAAFSVPPAVTTLLCGLLEMTTGCAALSEISSPLTLSLSCFFVTFGGVCVLVQQAAFLTRVGVKMLPLFAVKFLQGICSAGICFCLSLALF